MASTASTAGETEPLEAIEVASAVLVRNFELLRHRSSSYQDLDRAEYLLLRALQHTGPADICTLAAALGLDPSTAGRQVAAMQRKDLVTRAPSSADRRRSIISPTDTGQERMHATARRRRENTAELLADWSPEDLQSLATMFARYNQAVARAFLTTPPAPPSPTPSQPPG